MSTDLALQTHRPPWGQSIVSALLAAWSGGMLWLWAAHASGKLEAWDGPFYFSRVVPAMALIAALCGFLAPRHPWRWPAAMFATQFAIMLARAEPPVGPLAPLGFIMMAVLAALLTPLAYLGALARRLRNRRRDRMTASPPMT